MLVAMGGAYSRHPWIIVENIGTPEGCNNAASVKRAIVLHPSVVRFSCAPYRGWREYAQPTATNITPLRGENLWLCVKICAHCVL